MYILRALAVLFLTQAVLAQQPTPILPDPKLTPGDTFEVTAQDVCVPGYAKKVRAVPAWLKRQAYAEYGITQYKTGDYEVDHLIPLSLGGSNSIRNLWPQSTKTAPWNSYVKDALERKLHKLVCAGQLDLKTAQREGSEYIIGGPERVPRFPEFGASLFVAVVWGQRKKRFRDNFLVRYWRVLFPSDSRKMLKNC